MVYIYIHLLYSKAENGYWEERREGERERRREGEKERRMWRRWRVEGTTRGINGGGSNKDDCTRTSQRQDQQKRNLKNKRWERNRFPLLRFCFDMSPLRRHIINCTQLGAGSHQSDLVSAGFGSKMQTCASTCEENSSFLLLVAMASNLLAMASTS